MSFSENFADGAALASLELHRSLITLLVLNKTLPKDMTMEIIDQALQRIEGYQMSGNASLVAPAQAARHHIEGLLQGLSLLPDPAAK
ncbi:hypothetical protein [Brucella inopinata]|uniref:hypothetical protein n=1 Tax=Brucella inopinata TaxID=1218315 RepID=UPI0008DA9991|nr:hypothetical protein [Brucella inopinata]